jgi:hypothetical protein
VSNFERVQFDTSGGGFSSRELFIPQSELPITPESLIIDNHSDLAEENRTRNQEAAQNGETDLTFVCSDARIIIPNFLESLIVGAISAGGNREGFRKLINHRLRSIVNLAHYGLPSKDRVLPITKLKGCGGLLVKDLLEQGLIDDIPEDDVLNFVKNDIYHSDPILQTTIASRKVAEINETGIPIAAAAENHITGEIGILGVFLNRNGKILQHIDDALDPLLLNPSNYKPEEVYKYGIPFVDLESLPDDCESIFNYVMAQNVKMKRMREWYPDLEKTQAIQNRVRAVLWTSSSRPAQLRFPNLFKEPGSLFLVSQARAKDIIYSGDYATQRVQVTKEALKQGINQVQYPLTEAVSHKDEPDKGFHGTNTLIIERSDMEIAIRDQGELLKRQWAQEWFNLPNSQIITLETRGGVITQFGEY